ncbi:MAG: hypothetical protein H6709_17550 [Kofleriaceae bacterium]|nr:hypothetical protein [Myxococcales bacterium]MCB9573889.1 hypothetical protein [Kofleriaceae bacterium]
MLAVAPATAAAGDRRDAAYLELLGKGGLWSAGYEHRLDARLGVGVAASASWIADERLLSASPYLGVVVRASRRHAWFAQTGPQLVLHHVRAAVPEVDDHGHTGAAWQATSGWELRGALLVRASLSVIAGPGGVVPWGGVAVGVRW